MAKPTANVVVASSGTVRFRVRAVDADGTIGAWVAGPTLSPRLIQQWSAGGPVSRHVVRGFVDADVRRDGTVLADSGSLGELHVHRPFPGPGLDDRADARPGPDLRQRRLLTTIDLRAATGDYRAVVWSRTWSTSVTRTVKVVVVGTSGRPRVDLDAFAVLR